MKKDFKTSKKLLFKEAIKSVLENKSYMILLGFLIMLTSFMYFFVQFSIDRNMDYLEAILQSGTALTKNQTDFLVALQSNASLARTFLVCFLIMSAFVAYLFYHHYFNQHQREIGCLKALGFDNYNIVKTYMLCTLLLSTLATLIGMLLGWMLSGVLLTAYTTSYDIIHVEKGIHAVSIFYGIILVILVLCLTTILSCKTFCKTEAALLIGDVDTKKDNLTINRIVERITTFWPESKRFSIRIALRKPITLVLCGISVGVSVIFFIMSISLYLSSDKVYRSQTEIHNYNYNVSLDEISQDYFEEPSNSDLYLEVTSFINIKRHNESVSQQIIGISSDRNLLELFNSKNETLDIPDENEILISAALKEVYGLKRGDTVTLSISGLGENYAVEIAGVAENAESNCIYMARNQLAHWLEVPETSYNGYLSNEVEPSAPGEITTKADRLIALDKEVVSNRMSAVITQLLGCVAGIILIYLVLLLNFQDNTKEMLVLGLLGYRPKEINQMMISIYKPIITFAFLLVLYPAISICKGIHRSLSIQTGDYIPFQTNLIIILGIFIVVQIIYAVVEKVFTGKIEKIIQSDTVFHYL